MGDLLFIGGKTTDTFWYGDVYKSTNGSNWSNIKYYGSIARHSAVTFNGKIYLIAGNYGSVTATQTVKHSIDGITWTSAPNATFPARYNHTSVVFDGKIWVIGGENGTSKLNDVWYSADGNTWTQATTSINGAGNGMTSHCSLVFNNKMWVLGGFAGDSAYNGRVYSSTDGVTWTQTNDGSQWAIKAEAGACVFNDKMWFVGGKNGTSSNDIDAKVLFSTDGITWNETSYQMHLANFNLIAWNGFIWAFGGTTMGSSTKDAKKTTDGITWTSVTTDIPSVRYDYTVTELLYYDGELINSITGESISSGSLAFEFYPQLNISAITGTSVSQGNLEIVAYGLSTDVVEGYVILNGQPVENAIVEAIDMGSGEIFRGTTDAQGYYSFPVYVGLYHVTCRYEDTNGNKYSSVSKPWTQVIV